MSDSNRNNYIALGIALLFTAVFVGSYLSFGEYQNKHAQQREHVSAYQAETSEQYPEICFKEGTSVASLFKCLVKTVDANRNAQRTQYDLEAQQEMAQWAYGLFLLTFAGIFLSVGGLIVLLYSLYQTRTAIKDNRELGEAQTRAYLTATGGLYRVEPHIIFFQPMFKNTGNSPARRITTKIRVRLVIPPAPKGPPNTQWESIEFDGTCDDIASNSDTLGQATLYSSEAPADKLQQLIDVRQFYLEGVIGWFDVFEKKQTISFALLAKKAEWREVGGDRVLIGKLFAVMNRENQAAQ